MSLSDAGPLPSQQQINQLARRLRRVLKIAKRLADKERKPLRIVIGEIHNCRDGLLVTCLLTWIARDLGIQVIAVEGGRGEPEAAVDPEYPNFESKLRAAEAAQASGELPAEKGKRSTMPERLEQNQVFQMVAALQAGWKRKEIVDCDPLRNLVGVFADGRLATYAQRHQHTLSILRNLAAQRNSVLSLHGSMHVAAMWPELAADTSAFTVVFDTATRLYNWRIIRGLDYRNLADAVVLTRWNTRKLATGKRIIHLCVPGGEIKTAADAFKLSQGARQAVSENASLSWKVLSTPPFTGVAITSYRRRKNQTGTAESSSPDRSRTKRMGR